MWRTTELLIRYVLVLLFVAAILFGINISNKVNTLGVSLASQPNSASAGFVPLQNVQQIAAGLRHTCAVTTSGSVKCWGANYYGQLGDGTNSDHLTPVDVVGLNSGISTVASEFLHTCALSSGGVIKCWGNNFDGQLGDNTTSRRLAPVNVAGLNSFIISAIAVGGFHTCALTSVGGVWCWGYDGDGQLGDDSALISHQAPVPVAGLSSGVVAIAAGHRHNCALLGTGKIKCWGYNRDGELGDGTTTNRPTPVDVTMSDAQIPVSKLFIGPFHTCVLTTSNKAVCWGANDYGQLGNTTIQTTARAPGWHHTCTLTTGGGVQCWGYNQEGELGNGTNTNSFTPVNVVGLNSGVQMITSGEWHSCALLNTRQVQCWGMNASGQTGDSNATDYRLPVDAAGLTSGVSTLAAGGYHTCALTVDNKAHCWGAGSNGQLGNNSNLNRQTPVDIVGFNSALSGIAAGSWHTCAVTATDGVACWGSNGNGRLGDGTTSDRWTPVNVSSLSDKIKQVVAGSDQTCAVTTSGGAQCWGLNNYGQLGDGSTTDRLTPVNVTSLTSGVRALSAGAAHICALTNADGVKCWGYSATNDSRLGNGATTPSTTPVDVSGLTSGVKALAVGGFHACVLTNAGGVKCWGQNSYGQLGDGTTTNRPTPVDVVGLTSGVKLIAAGGFHTCVLMETGEVKCWGNNTDGEVGDGTNADHLTPNPVVGLNGTVSLLELGDYYSCALTNSGGVKCWGWNGAGQLGDGKAWRLVPITVMVEGVPTPTSTPTATSTATPVTPPTATATATSTDTATPTTTAQGQAVDTATPTLTSTPPTTGDHTGFAYLPLVEQNPFSAPAQPKWQQIGQAGLDANTLAIGGNLLFMGERKTKNGRPGGLYSRSLTTCVGTPNFTRVDTINDTSVLGLAFHDTQGVAATYDINVFYSNNTGNSWTQTTSVIQHPSTVAIAGGSVFYIGTQDNGIYHSTNGGSSWQSLPINPPPPKDINVVKLDDIGTLWIGAETGASKLTLTGLIPVVGNLNDVTSKQIWDFAFRSASEIYIATFNGVYRGDGANDWQNFGLQGTAVYSLELHDNFLYAGTPQSGVWRRDLNGGNWEAVTSPGWNAAAKVRDLLYDPTNCLGLLAATADGVWIYR